MDGTCQVCENFTYAYGNNSLGYFTGCKSDVCTKSEVQKTDGTCSTCEDYSYPGEEIGSCETDTCDNNVQILLTNGSCQQCPDYFRPDEANLNCTQDEVCAEMESRNPSNGICERCQDHTYPNEDLTNCIADVC